MYNIYKGTDGRQKGLNNIKNPNKKNEIEIDFFARMSDFISQ